MLINSSIPEDQKAILAKIRDQLPLFVSNIRSASKAQEENTKKLESMKADAIEVTKLKDKFEAAKSKKMDLEKGAIAAREEMARLRFLVEKEEAKLANLDEV